MERDLVQRSGVGRLPETVSAYEIVLQNVASDSTFYAMRGVPTLLDEGETLVALAHANQALRTGRVLAMTNERLLSIDESNPSSFVELPLDGWSVTVKQSRWMGQSVILDRNDGASPVKLSGLLPIAETHRILTRLGVEPPRHSFEALPAGDFSVDPGHPPIAAWADIALYEDRVIDDELRHLPFNGEVEAVADAAGAIAVTRGRNLAAKGLGTLAFGPIGLFFMGNAKHREIDQRALYLLIAGPNWAYTKQFDPDVRAGLTSFAQRINAAATEFRKRSEQAGPAPSAEAPSSSLGAELRELASLRDDGILTDEEFQAQKQKLLNRG